MNRLRSRRVRYYEEGGMVEPEMAPAQRADAPKPAEPAPKESAERGRNPVQDSVEEAPDIKEPEQGTLSKLFDKLFGAAPTAVRRFLKQHGDKPISNLRVRRIPIASALNKVLDVIAAGQWSKAKSKVGYDQLFHLFMEFDVQGAGRKMIEKNQVVKIAGPKSGGESMDVRAKEGLTLNKLMSDAIKKYGEKRIYVYDPFSTNCQLFISHLLSAQGLLTSSLKKFIYQPIDQLVKDLPSYTGKVGKSVTDVAALVDRAIQFFTGGRIALKRGGLVGYPRPK